MIKQLWKWFWRPASASRWGAVFLLGGVAGVVFWGGFNTFMEYTNNMSFCISCHEMETNVYQEYKESVHYKNASGVRATCADCHVPKEWTPKVIRKIQASNEIFHKLIGSVDTREKFVEKRMELARDVWRGMMATDSRECRNCHSYDAMHWEEQSRKAKMKMKKASKEGKTCIECHHGIAHELPDDIDFDEEMGLSRNYYQINKTYIANSKEEHRYDQFS
ncbi:MAG: Denitrification system component NirT [Gammaproteobacteria bacterium]|nr:Denitrification system component NirT [Gammaproteobacteria bacterium]